MQVAVSPSTLSLSSPYHAYAQYGTQFFRVSMRQLSTKLQSANYDLKLAIDLLESLYGFTDDIRNRFDDLQFRVTRTTCQCLSDHEAYVRHFDEMRGTDVVLQGRECQGYIQS